jgi:hypothetical protein
VFIIIIWRENVQNELKASVTKYVKYAIILKLQQTRYSIILGSNVDVSCTEQMTIVLRHVDENQKYVKSVMCSWTRH